MKNLKVIEIEKATEPLSTYAKDLGNDMLVLTSDKEPVAVLIHLGSRDKESLALSINREFMDIIEHSREEIRQGKKLSLNEMKEEFSNTQGQG